MHLAMRSTPCTTGQVYLLVHDKACSSLKRKAYKFSNKCMGVSVYRHLNCSKHCYIANRHKETTIQVDKVV